MEVGSEVEYDAVVDDKGKTVAENVTLPGGGAFVGVQDPAKANRKLSRVAVSGEVIFFKRESGYGFLSNDQDISWPERMPAGSQIYVDREELINAEGSACNLSKGMKVEYKVYKPEGREGLAAAEVTGPGGEPLIYEPEPKGKGKGKGKGKDYYGKGYSKGYDEKGYSKGYGEKGYSDYWHKGDYWGKGDYSGKGGYSSKGDAKGYGGAPKGGSSGYPGVHRTIQKPAFVVSQGSSPSRVYPVVYPPSKASASGRSSAPIGGSATKVATTPPWREERSSTWSSSREGYKGSKGSYRGGKGY